MMPKITGCPWAEIDKSGKLSAISATLIATKTSLLIVFSSQGISADAFAYHTAKAWPMLRCLCLAFDKAASSLTQQRQQPMPLECAAMWLIG
jgi:hypothetical protein